ncbi:MAG: bacterial Ig-like domain-containing protein [Clostridia bacterium]|nr:bacterial Ig-like domain-containing protein [Clostridia bacterium]
MDTLEYETEVRVGEAYDTSKITKATVTYGDNIFTEEVGVNDLVIDTITTQEKGIKELKVSYNGYTQNISIIVHGVRDITLNDEIKAVIINQELNLDNITLANVTYEDDYVEENVAIADLQIGNIDTTTSGVKQLTISYKGFSKVFDVLVKDYKELNVTGDLPVNVRKNDTIDLSNLVIIVVFDDESTMEITLNDVLVIGNDTTNVGQKTLVISYLDLDYSHNYNVVGVTKIELMESEYETQVRIGQEYDITKITQATVTYGDGVFVDTVLREDLSIDNITTTEKGIKQLKIAYNGYVESLDITVHGVKDITLNGDIQSVLVNETLNLDNITLANITYEDDYVEENVAIADLQIGTIDTTTSGTKLLTISYKGFDKNFEVEVIGYQSLTVEGTLPTEVLLYQDFDLSGITKFILTYTNSTTKELSIDDVEITGIDTETNGEKTLTIKYGTVQYTHNYTVIGIIVAGFDAPKSLTDYNTNKTNTTGDASFTIANRDYVVGTENAYVLNPIIDAYDENGDPVAINEVATNITFEVSSDNEHFTAVTDTSLYLDRIGETNVDIDFNEDAVGKYFKITVNAVENEEEKFTHTFKVVKGYNIYTAKQLAVVDNSQSEWDDIKAEMGLQNVTTNTIILHDRIVITKDDIPAANFWTAEELTEKGLDQSIVGSFKEEQNSDYVMVREIAENSAFTVYGNYFDIDASQIPLCKWNSGDGYTSAGAITMHASLFNFRNSTNALNAKVYMQEISFLGNTQRTDDPLMSGGLLLFKTNNITMDIDNTAFQKWYTAYMFEDTINYITIDGVNYTLRDYCNEYYTFVKDSVTYYLSKENDKPTNKVYDSSALANQVFTENTISVTRNFNEINHTKGFECYNTHFYMWGAQVNIRNSVMKSAGGPVLIADHVNSSHFGSSEADIKAGINGRPSYVYIYDSQLESYISGLEPWFETYGATALVTQMKQLDVYFNADATRLAAGSSEMNSVYAYVVQQIMEAYSCDLDTAIATLEQISASYSMTMNSTFLKEIEGVPLMNLVSVSKSGSAEGLTTYRTRNIIEFVDNGVSQAGLKTGGSYADTVTGYGQMVIIENTRNGQYFDPVAGYMGYTTDSANNGMVNSAFSSCYTTGNTYLNFYIFNGMGVSMQLFPKN